MGTKLFYILEDTTSIDNERIYLDDDDVPSHFHYREFTPNTGAKIAVEVAENGFILKSGKNITVCNSDYDVQSQVRKLAYKVNTRRVPVEDNPLKPEVLQKIRDLLVEEEEKMA